MPDARHHEMVSDLFRRAVGLSRAERVALLAQFPEHEAEVRSLLAADAAAGGFLAESPVASFAPPAPLRLERFGPFDVLEFLASGGTSHVYLARERASGELVALKILSPFFVTEDGLRRMQREAAILRRLALPGLASIVASGTQSIREVGQLAYVATRYVRDARPLTAACEDARASEAGLHSVLRLFSRLCTTLSKVHATGVLHRDLKPANILVDGAGEPVIIDFGIAALRATDLETVTRSGSAVGSIPYMAPEQLTGAPSEGPCSDLWSIGVTLYECVSGERPFRGATVEAIRQAALHDEPADPRQLNALISSSLRAVIGKALEKTPRHRYADAESIARDLDAVARGDRPRARPASMARRAGRWAVRYPWVIVAFAAAIGLLILEMAHRRALEMTNALGDEARLESLVRRADALWPRRSFMRAELERWLADAAEVVERRAIHLAGAAAGRESPRHQRILELFDAVEPLRQDVAARARVAAELRRQTLADSAAVWRRCQSQLNRDPRFEGLMLEPSEGLVPLGPDASSGLWEFWLPEAGRAPRRESGRIAPPRADDGVVLVLVPPGRVRLGLSHEEFALGVVTGVSELSVGREIVRVDAFYASKFELTQGQWTRLAGSNPSLYYPGEPMHGESFDLRHPVEQVSWSEARELLGRVALRLPTEAEWVHAARAGTDWIWPTGDAPDSLRGYANLRGGDYDRVFVDFEQKRLPLGIDLNDAFPLTAPAGSFAPNPWGLHDVIGNVAEWTESRYRRLGRSTAASDRSLSRYRAVCGGSFRSVVEASFVGRRTRRAAESSAGTVGVRAAMTPRWR
ncbi:MAG: bifunctional serine/threonine-protein kinase/formylglycine-generating enzyme family protein [Planctomycetota bacterium]